MEARDNAALEPVVSNTEFLWSLLKALIALTLSAAILIPSYLAFSPELKKYREAASSDDIRRRVITGADLIVRMGTGTITTNQALELTALAEDGKEGRALLTRNVSLLAGDYPFIEYTITNRHPGEKVYLIWRTAEEPEIIHNALLYWSGDKATAFHLGKEEAWRGRITEVGLDVYGDLRGRPLAVQNLIIAPESWGAVLSTIWSEWTAFEGWTQKSINYLRGTPENAVLSPTVAIAAWTGLALLLLVIPYLYTKNHNVIAYGVAIFIPWVALDFLWQGELNTQLDETKYLFSGKTQHEKHLVDTDAEIYEYAQYLKNEMLPEPGFRLFILNNSMGADYRKLKTHFYLLPHNIFSFHMGHAPQLHMREGDYILVVEALDELNTFSEPHTLDWGSYYSLPLTLIDNHQMGSLYKVPTGKTK